MELQAFSFCRSSAAPSCPAQPAGCLCDPCRPRSQLPLHCLFTAASGLFPVLYPSDSSGHFSSTFVFFSLEQGQGNHLCLSPWVNPSLRVLFDRWDPSKHRRCCVLVVSTFVFTGALKGFLSKRSPFDVHVWIHTWSSSRLTHIPTGCLGLLAGRHTEKTKSKPGRLVLSTCQMIHFVHSCLGLWGVKG